MDRDRKKERRRRIKIEQDSLVASAYGAGMIGLGLRLPDPDFVSSGRASRRIGFSPEMLDAIRVGKKAQTRRPYQGEPVITRLLADGTMWPVLPDERFSHGLKWVECPVAWPGDHLIADGIELWVARVRFERLQEISDQDVFSEGFQSLSALREFWDQIYENKGFGWATNPFVWVLEFEHY